MEERAYYQLKRHLEDHFEEYCQASGEFYRRAIHALPELEAIFGTDPEKRQRKYLSMLSTIKHLKYFDRLRPAIRKMGARHRQYGAMPAHFEVVTQAFLQAIQSSLGDHIDEATLGAWQAAMRSLSEEMRQAPSEPSSTSVIATSPTHNTGSHRPLDTHLGAEEVIHSVHLRFYEKLFAHPWLGQFFYGKSLTALARKQTVFMIACLGGDNTYKGETPATAHMHMYITQEMLEVREAILRETILAHEVAPPLAERWLAADRGFWGAIAKLSPDECVTRCPGQMPIIIKDEQKFG